MQTYLIEPKAPLVVRSGRPFDEQNGADAARFPPPSTLAGALRTAHAETVGKSFSPELAKIGVIGPLPVKIDAKGKAMLLVPKPADALYFWSADKLTRKLVRTIPLALAQGEGCDLPVGLLPVQLAEEVKGKPAPGPRWWSWGDVIAFRKTSTKVPTLEQLEQRGWSPLADEMRTHVGIDPAAQAAESGKLFQTAGLSCWQRTEKGDTFPVGGVGIVGRIAGKINSGVITLGGERRLSAIKIADELLWPKQPQTLAAEIQNARGLTLTLLTPALFDKGWHPGWLNDKLEGTPPGRKGLRLKLRAVAVDRWQPHSGWDLVENKPRAGRKLVPAGAVFWFDILEAPHGSLAELWLTPISDHEQDRLDGFGLALPQPWRNI